MYTCALVLNKMWIIIYIFVAYILYRWIKHISLWIMWRIISILNIVSVRVFFFFFFNIFICCLFSCEKNTPSKINKQTTINGWKIYKDMYMEKQAYIYKYEVHNIRIKHKQTWKTSDNDTLYFEKQNQK